MITPESGLHKLNKNLTLYNIKLNDSEKSELQVLFNLLKTSLPESASISVHLFEEGKDIHGEAIVNINDKCIISRKSSVDSVEVMRSLKSDLIQKTSIKSIFYSSPFRKRLMAY